MTRVISGSEEFKIISNIVVINRITDDIIDIEEKIYLRYIFSKD